MKNSTNKMFLVLSIFLLVWGIFAGKTYADKEIDKIHFLIPAGAGGGWDGTARGVGEALTKSKLIKRASYQNMSGGSGGKGIAYLIKTARRQQGTLLVNSTPNPYPFSAKGVSAHFSGFDTCCCCDSGLRRVCCP